MDDLGARRGRARGAAAPGAKSEGPSGRSGRIDTDRLGSARLGSVRFGSVRLVRFGSARFRPLGSTWNGHALQTLQRLRPVNLCQEVQRLRPVNLCQEVPRIHISIPCKAAHPMKVLDASLRTPCRNDWRGAWFLFHRCRIVQGTAPAAVPTAAAADGVQPTRQRGWRPKIERACRIRAAACFTIGAPAGARDRPRGSRS